MNDRKKVFWGIGIILVIIMFSVTGQAMARPGNFFCGVLADGCTPNSCSGDTFTVDWCEEVHCYNNNGWLLGSAFCQRLFP